MQKLSKDGNDINCVSPLQSLRAYFFNYCGKVGWQRCLGGKRVITPLPAERGNQSLVLFLL